MILVDDYNRLNVYSDTGGYVSSCYDVVGGPMCYNIAAAAVVLGNFIRYMNEF